MLFVKNMVFVDAAIGTLAPDLDLFAHVTDIATYFATNHAQALMADLGVDPTQMEVDLTSFKDSLGVDRELETVTYADLQARRELIQSRMREHSKQRKRGLFSGTNRRRRAS
jgi:ubiquinone biosynthesis protein